MLEALGDRTRRTLLSRLQQGPSSVAELADGLPVGRPAVSQHLKVLKAAGLVTDRPVGTRRLYELDPSGLAALQRYAEALWAAALGALQDSAPEARGTAP